MFKMDLFSSCLESAYGKDVRFYKVITAAYGVLAII